MSDLPDPSDVQTDPEVKKAKEAVREEKQAIKEMKTNLQEARQQVQNLKQDLAEKKADARIGDATEADVDEVREQLVSQEEEAQRLQAEITTSERAVQKLEGKLRQKKNEAAAKIENVLRQEYRDRLKAAIRKMQDAQQAVRAAGEVGSTLRSQPMRSVASMNDHPQKLVEGNLDHATMEVGAITSAGHIRYRADELEQLAAQAGVTT